jgi:hypothetical protein
MKPSYMLEQFSVSACIAYRNIQFGCLSTGRPDPMLSSTHSLLPFLRQVTVPVTSRTKAWMLDCCAPACFSEESQKFQRKMLPYIVFFRTIVSIYIYIVVCIMKK